METPHQRKKVPSCGKRSAASLDHHKRNLNVHTTQSESESIASSLKLLPRQLGRATSEANGESCVVGVPFATAGFGAKAAIVLLPGFVDIIDPEIDAAPPADFGGRTAPCPVGAAARFLDISLVGASGRINSFESSLDELLLLLDVRFACIAGADFDFGDAALPLMAT